jgi:hypothetical protein
MNVGDIIKFGRPNGVLTRGKIVKVNSKTVKVKLLEHRGIGRGCAVGTVWTVHKSLCRPIGAAPPAALTQETSYMTEPQRSESSLVESAIAKLSAPESMALRRHFVRLWRLDRDTYQVQCEY